MYPNSDYGYGYRDWEDAVTGMTSIGTGWYGTTSTEGDYSGTTSDNNGTSGTGTLGGDYTGTTSMENDTSRTASLGWEPLRGRHQGTTSWYGMASTERVNQGTNSVNYGISGTGTLVDDYSGTTSVKNDTSGTASLGWGSLRGSHPGTNFSETGWYGTTSTEGADPGTHSVDYGTSGTGSLEGVHSGTTSFGDKSRIDRLSGIDEGTGYGMDEYTIPLPDELIQMFLPRECKLCDVSLTCLSSAYTHYEGKAHQKAVAEYMKENYGIKGSLLRRRTKFKPVLCEVCKKTLTSRVDQTIHFAGKIHARNLSKTVYQATKPAMEDVVDFMFQPPTPPLPPVLNEFVCDVCHIPTSTEYQLIMHKEGSKHKRKLREMEKKAEEEYEESYDEEELYSYEEGDYEASEKDSRENFEDFNMDQPLQFGSDECANSTTTTPRTCSTTKASDSKEDSAQWEYPLDLMFPDLGETSGAWQERKKDIHESGGSQENKMNNSINKANPGAATLFHKYKSALEARKFDMISRIIPPEKSQTVKPETKEPSLIPPDVQKIGQSSESQTTSANTRRVPDSTAGSDTSCTLREPYYKANVGFHRRKSPSTENSSGSRGGNHDRRLQQYESYRRGSRQHREAWQNMKYRVRASERDRYGEGYRTVKGKYDIDCERDSRFCWYRSKLLNEHETRIRSMRGVRERYKKCGKRCSYHRSQSREIRLKTGRKERKRKPRKEHSKRELSTSEFERTSSIGRSSRSGMSSSRSSMSSRIVRKASKQRSLRNTRYVRSRKTRRSEERVSRSRSRSARKFQDSDDNMEVQAGSRNHAGR